jgi:hypothetical protein
MFSYYVGASIASSVICHPLHVIMMRQRTDIIDTCGYIQTSIFAYKFIDIYIHIGASIASSVICHPLHVIMMRQQTGVMAASGGFFGVFYSIREAIDTLGLKGF